MLPIRSNKQPHEKGGCTRKEAAREEARLGIKGADNRVKLDGTAGRNTDRRRRRGSRRRRAVGQRPKMWSIVARRCPQEGQPGSWDGRNRRRRCGVGKTR